MSIAKEYLDERSHYRQTGLVAARFLMYFIKYLEEREYLEYLEEREYLEYLEERE